MKYFQSHFEDYINENNVINLHPKLKNTFDKFPDSINNLKNIILYGPSGIGKYTQMLCAIKKYSSSNLKYERKISITYNKQQYLFKCSDIHYEIDMSLLGCNAKMLWHEIYQQLFEVISAKPNKSGIIVCKYFHEIHSELLDNFYSYMQKIPLSNINIIFILITEEVSFMSDNILNCCEIIHISRPSKLLYNNCCKNKLSSKIKLENITNIKLLNDNCDEHLMQPYRIICDKIINNIININELHFGKFRDILYDIFIYNLDISDCIWYIISTLVNKQYINEKNISDIIKNTYCFFQYYNNNYRPIFHVENYFLCIAKQIHLL